METCFEILMAPDQTFLLLLRQLCDHAMRIAFAICCFGTVVHSGTVVALLRIACQNQPSL